MKGLITGLITLGCSAWLAWPDASRQDASTTKNDALPGMDSILLAQADPPGSADDLLPPGPPSDRPPGAPEDEPGFGHRGPPNAGPLSREEAEQLLAFTGQHFPELHKHLERLRQAGDRRGFMRMARRVHGPLSRIMEIRKQDPRLAQRMIDAMQLEMKLAALQRQRRFAPASKRDEISKEARELLSQRFDLRLERLRYEIQDMERRLAEAKKQLAKRQENKDRYVDQELKEFMKGRPGPAGPGPRPFMRDRGRGHRGGS